MYTLLLGLATNGFTQTDNEPDTALAPHVRMIERAIAARSLDVIRGYLHPQKTFVDFLGKPASYLSVNQATAVIESFLRDNALTSYSMDVIREMGVNGIALGALRARSREGMRALKLTLSFTKETNHRWLITRIVIR